MDIACKSLELEKDKDAVLFGKRKVAQERLIKEIEVEQKLKQQRKLAEWRENDRIQKEANLRTEKEDRRRAGVIEKREQTMKFREKVCGRGDAQGHSRAIAWGHTQLRTKMGIQRQ